MCFCTLHYLMETKHFKIIQGTSLPFLLPTHVFLNKVLVSPDGSNEDVTVCSADEVEEAKAVLRLIPIWVSCLAYGIAFSQASTLFTKQGATMDRSIGSTFEIPPATLQSFINLSVIILIPIYDMVIVPLTRAITNIASGITML
ncbi:putative proton-dependent oligopeptide transporter family, MFS transporter superfamily [Helianthus annuus]|nr:putative proton-dependent oligopeptide transporter family, MFS transporter superfamily [Helianthus annuus]